jgi:hypothetical protein
MQYVSFLVNWMVQMNFQLNQASTNGHVHVQHHIKEIRAILNLIVLHPVIAVRVCRCSLWYNRPEVLKLLTF